MSSIMIHVKNLAGDVQSVEMPDGSGVEELVKRLSALDIAQYPSYRTRIFRPFQEESKEEADSALKDGEMVSVFVSEGYDMEEGIIDGDRFAFRVGCCLHYGGTPFARITFPFMSSTYYLYFLHQSFTRQRTWTGREYLLSQHPTLYQHSPCNRSTELVDVLPRGFSIERLRQLEQMADSYYERKRKEKEEEDALRARKEIAERYEGHELCVCGSMVKKTGLKAHYKTKKHQTYLASEKQ